LFPLPNSHHQNDDPTTADTNSDAAQMPTLEIHGESSTPGHDDTTAVRKNTGNPIPPKHPHQVLKRNKAFAFFGQDQTFALHL
jgi:hypothetical protein